MNIFRCPKLLVCEMYSPFFEGTIISKIDISAVASSALNALHSSYEAVAGKKNEPEALYLRKHPMNEKERELFQICRSAVLEPEKENDETLILQAQNLIKEGIGIHPLFITEQRGLMWLRMHCTKELCERAAISKKGLELIDFETLLPPDWQPPDWLSSPQELEIQEKLSHIPATFIPETFIKDYKEAFLFLRQKLRQFALEKGCNHPILFIAPTLAQVLSQDWRIAYIVYLIEMAALKIITKKTPLNQNDMERLHKKALQNPLYETLWKKVENTTPTSLKFVDASKFVRPGLSIGEVSNAHLFEGNIEIYQDITERSAFESLIFESANAFQRNRFNEVKNKICQGKISTEEIVRLTEYVEWESLNIFYRIMDRGAELHDWPKVKFTWQRMSSFKKVWEYANQRFPIDKKNSHADGYRHQFKQTSFLYYINHPETAPSNADWMNEIPEGDMSPLEFLIMNPEIALEWEIDPFIQLIDKGAKVEQRTINLLTIKAIVAKSDSNQEEIAIQNPRIHKLLELGFNFPCEI